MKKSGPYRDYTIDAIEQRIEELLEYEITHISYVKPPPPRRVHNLAKYKELRKERQNSLRSTHRHILKVVAFILNTDISILEEGVVDKDEYLEVFNSFLSKGGCRSIMIHYQPMDPPPIESGRWNSRMKNQQKVMRCCVTDGTTEYLSGKAVVVYRLRTDVEFEKKQLIEETYYAYVETDENSGALAGVLQLILRLNKPAIEANTQWKDLLAKEDSGLLLRDKFMRSFNDFIDFLQTSHDDLCRVTKFNAYQDVYDKYTSTVENMMESAQNYDAIVEIENCVRVWTKQLERVLIENDQLRREKKDIGPKDELRFWRGMLTRFYFVVNHLKRPETQMFLTPLILAGSKLVEEWQTLDYRISTINILARDNFKYLNGIEKFLKPLYYLEPLHIVSYLPVLMSVIKLVYSTSRFFNTQKMITCIFAKISNQLIITCKNYLTENGTLSIWHEARAVISSKLKNCVRLYKKYFKSYRRVIRNVDESCSKEFLDISETVIFRKFNQFKMRLEQLIEVFDTHISHRILRSSRIESIDLFEYKLTGYFRKISTQDYDPLNFLEPFFDPDYNEFVQNVTETELDMRAFFFRIVSYTAYIDEALRVVLRFQKLNLPRLLVDHQFLELVTVYETEMKKVQKEYNKKRHFPPLPRNTPPVAGRILWIRQLSRRIETPIIIFRQQKKIMNDENMLKCVRMYNALVNVFIHYEVIYHKAWFDSAEAVRLSLTLPLLVKDSKQPTYIINFDPIIHEVIREASFMLRLGLDVPDLIKIVLVCQKKIYSSYEVIKKLVRMNNDFKNSVPEAFLQLMRPAFRKMDFAFRPCLSTITWISLDIPDICSEIHQNLQEVELFMKKLLNTQTVRVEEVIDTIAETQLIYFPDEPLSPAQFSSKNYDLGRNIAKELETQSFGVENAVINMIDRCLGLITDPEVEEDKYYWLDSDQVIRQIGSEAELTSGTSDVEHKSIDESAKVNLTRIHRDCMEVFTHFNNKMVEALLKCTKRSLDMLKKRIGLIDDDPEDIQTPLLLTHFILQIPNIVLSPSIEELNNYVQTIVKNLIQIHKGIIMWGQRQSSQERAMKIGVEKTDQNKMETYYETIAEHKIISRIVLNFQVAIYMFRDDINYLRKIYIKKYRHVWTEDKDFKIQEFIDSNPEAYKIRDRFVFYENLITEIENISSYHIIGPIKINMDKLKLGLLVEVIGQKATFGKTLKKAYTKKFQFIDRYINDKNMIFRQPMKNLDDVRRAMKCLDQIRKDYVSFDIDLFVIDEVYTMMEKYKIPIDREDLYVVYSLDYEFRKMLRNATETQQQIRDMEEPLRNELIKGVKNLRKDIENFDNNYRRHGPMEVGIPARDACDRLFVARSRCKALWEWYQIYNSGEALFGLPLTEYPILHERREEISLLQKLYGLYSQVMRTVDGYYSIPWSEVDIEKITAELADLKDKCKRLPKGMQDWPAYIDLKKKIDDFNETCPLLEMMTDKAMKDRHWEKMSNLCNYVFDVESYDFKLANVLQAPLLKFKDDVEDICISAVKEMEIESKLNQVIADWAIVDLQFANFKDRGELMLKGIETMEIISQLEDSLMVISSLMANRYNAFFKKSIQKWQTKLSDTSEVLTMWLTVQNLWAYLEAVFIGGDIAKQLPKEAKRFNNIDSLWVRAIHQAQEIMNAVETCTKYGTMQDLLPHLLQQLESCQKSLSGYLEVKRVIFARFCFVSDPTLLEILGRSADFHTINDYLDGLFDNIAKLKFSDTDYDKIVAIYSRENEEIVLEKEVTCTDCIENWLNVLLKMHQQSVGGVISQGLQRLLTLETSILTLIDDSILQVGLLALQTLWTQESEIAIVESKNEKMIMKNTNQSFLDLLNQLIEVTVQDLSQYQRAKYEALITIHVHQRDIFDELCRMKIKHIYSFQWLKQARFYYNNDTENVSIKITDVTFTYQNEFLGCTDRLVITPLTDRCYITLAQAVWMNFGGAPAGPAGTGKTETTKDMGKALGKYVIVFNCSDQMDFRGLGRIFKGLAQSGAWGCFDEFNRIELPVLSVAAQQIAIVLTARKERRTNFLFSDGKTYSIDYEFGIFITMNPGYAGRQELPENLKTQFRSVAMMVPDRQIIIRVKLAACGFKENIVLSRKFFTLYSLCEEQLSKQVHYDFGLRNILSCLRTLGAQKRAHPGESEETSLMRVLRAMNLSKLVDEDEPLFLSLISDMFPGVKLTTQTYKELQQGIIKATDELGIINAPEWNLKVIQLYETSLVRHGLMVLGPTGSGKTRCMWTLMKTLTEMGMPHKEVRMNPKAITASQMFGKLDVATNDWTDGIFSTLWRRSTQMRRKENLWIVLDGPVDAVWIENLNSVLDDNKTLTLANGDRIIMAPTSKLVFEPDNVDNASPATVSRMGMVFISASVLKWSPILEGWLKTRATQQAEILRGFFDKIYEDAHNFVQTKLVNKMKLLEAIYIRQCIDLLDGLLARTSVPSDLEKLFLFSLMWSLGAVLELDGRSALEDFFLTHPSKLNWPKPVDDETIFEYLVSDEGKWIHWSQMVPTFEYPSDHVLDYYTILVPNVDNTRTLFLMDIIAQQSKAVLLIGEQGTAKTVMLKSFMSKYDPEFHLSKSFNFSSASTPNMVQRVFESYVEKRVGTTYGPPGGKKMTVFIDDINMPDINEWGDQVTNEVVRQLMEYGGFYSLDKPGDFNRIQDIQLLAAMIHPGGGRNDIPARLKRQFNIFNCTLPSNKSMDTIFRSIGEGYFCDSRFSSEIVQFLPKLIPLTRVLWQRTKSKMLPTPAKFHYVFNLRDLSRIWEGILRIQKDECTTPNTLLKLWSHECTRVLSDRFTVSGDKEWFENTMHQTAEEFLEGDFQYYHSTETYFVDFLREAPEPTGLEPEDFVFDTPKIYEEIPNFETVIQKAEQYMEQFNELIKGMHLDLVFFHDALVHLMKISRILGVPRGHAMLVGVGGSGKQSLTKLASFIAGYKFFQIVLTRAYNVGSLLEDIKKLYHQTGVKNEGLTFIFTDNDIKDEGFLEYLNNVLSVGEVANLFSKDELDVILTNLIPVMKAEDSKRPPTQENLYSYFLSRARNNLHIVLCFSPVSEKFRSRSLKFPALISGCTMNWFARWPRDALCAVSEHFLQKFEVVCSTQIKQELINAMGEIQDGVNDICDEYFNRFRRRTYVTPKSFLSFIECYKQIYKQHLDEINTLAFRMNNGLKKLVDAADQVDELRKVLEKNQEEIAVKNVQVEKILVTVNEKKGDAEAVKDQVQKSKDEAEALLQIISEEKAIAEEKLKTAEPALLEAEEALQTIKSTDIATVRKLGKPPYLITLIMDCVIILFGRKLDPVKPDLERQFLIPSWSEALKVMADVRFLYNLRDFPKDNINAEVIDLMRPYLEYPSYNYEAAEQACGNVAGLLQWTIAMTKFYHVNKDVLPLKANLAVQQNKHDKANKNLMDAQEVLRDKDEDLQVIQREFDGVMSERQKIVDQAELCEAKMDTASALIEGLSEEQIRWTYQLATFKSDIRRLVGNVLVLTGFLSYCGPFNQEFRVLLQRRWLTLLHAKKIPVSPSINVVDSLSDTATTGEWNLQGLPNDELSIQNGIIVTKATRYPLLIDPQLQGKAWIKNKEKEFNLQTTYLSHKYFRNHLEDSISIGRPLLIEDVGEVLDPVLDNLLEKNFIKIGTLWKVKMGDKEVDVHPNFRLYITTKLPNPAYTPEVCAKTSIIDFTVTMKGLEDQLLGRVILTEKRELETGRTQLIMDVMMNKRKIKDLEENLLRKLTSVQGALIDDVELMSVLNTTRKTAADVTRKLEIAQNTEVEINAAREEFRPVAARGSVLYFLICDMAHVNCMYQTSLVQFLERFDLSLARSKKNPFNSRRIKYIIEYLTYEIFKYKARGLYGNHKYMFILLMALKIDLQRRSISHEEFQYFIKGGAALDLNAVQPKSCKWITDMTWLNLVALSSLPQFRSIISRIVASPKAWKKWYGTEAPEEEVIPDKFNKLDSFHRLLIIRAWCPDRILSQSRKYIADSLGAKYAEPVITLLDVMLAESRPNTPMIGFLSMGSDPTPSIHQLARKLKIPCRSISMGQGQEVHARKLLSEAKTQGIWVLFQNCHLGLDYMNELVNFILEMATPNPNFRIWITTEPHQNFPISLLQMSIKFTYEPPQGIRAGLLATYSGMNQDMLDRCDVKQYLPLVYTISFLHSIVQERRKFGPLGWNIPYEFNSTDWLASCMFINNHLNYYDPSHGISWQAVRYMVGQVQYGGRVTDDYDKRLLNTFTRVWLSEALFSKGFFFYNGYHVLSFKQVTEYLAAIEEMPSIDPPEVYGLHRNADITYQSRTTQDILDTIISVQPKESSLVGSGETREVVVMRQAKEMLEKLPPPYNPFEVKARLQAMGITQSMNIFLKQEIDRMQVVIELVRSMLTDLLLAIEGIIIMNEQLKDALDNIYDARIPKVWRQRSWESSTLGFWFTELLQRNQQFSSWIFRGRPHKFWMTGFFNPQGFLTAMRQEVTRSHKGWALDNVTLHNEVTKYMFEEVKNSPTEGVYVYGLYLEGAGWDRKNNELCESSKKVLYVNMPVIHIFALYNKSGKDPKLYRCPVYKKPKRTYVLLVTSLWLQTIKPPEYWILRGVALLCDNK